MSESARALLWHRLREQRWGPGVGDRLGGIVIDRPDPIARRMAPEAIAGQPGDADESGLDDHPRLCDRPDFRPADPETPR